MTPTLDFDQFLDQNQLQDQTELSQIQPPTITNQDLSTFEIDDQEYNHLWQEFNKKYQTYKPKSQDNNNKTYISETKLEFSLDTYNQNENFKLHIVYGKSMENKNPTLAIKSIQKNTKYLQGLFLIYLDILKFGKQRIKDFLQNKLSNIASEEVINHFFYQNPSFQAFYRSNYRQLILNLTQEYVKKTFTDKKIKETEPEALQTRKDFITYLYSNAQGQNLIKALVIKKYIDENQSQINQILANEVIITFITEANSIDEHFVHNFAEFAIAIHRLSQNSKLIEKADDKPKSNYSLFIDKILAYVGAVKTDPYNRRLASLILNAKNQLVKKYFDQLQKKEKQTSQKAITNKELYQQACKIVHQQCLDFPNYIGFTALRIYKNNFGIQKLEVEDF